MQKIKVLIVDDSAVIRKILGDVIGADADLEVIGTAQNGKVALEQIALLSPDIVTLDIEMPEMDGLETVKQIRGRGSNVPIIMCSSLTAAGASQTLEALAAGASDYVTKPSSHGINTREVVGHDLVQKIKAFARPQAPAIHAFPLQSTDDETHPHSVVLAPHSANERLNISEKAPQTSIKDLLPPEVIAIGVSTGGPIALQELLPRLPADFPIPILIVQHMPPLFTKILAERLHGQSKLPVSEGHDNQELKGGCIYIAPGGFHMEVQRRLGHNFIMLHEGPPENSCRPSVDVLFRSVASVYGERALAVMLTGMGQDGLNGCRKIKEAGGTIIAQNRESSTVWGMAGSVVQAGLPSAVLPLTAIASEIVSTATISPRSAGSGTRRA